MVASEGHCINLANEFGRPQPLFYSRIHSLAGVSATAKCGQARHLARSLDSELPTLAPNHASQYSWVDLCGGEPAGARTQDILIKSQVLYQLSYGLAGRGRGPGLARLGQ